MPITIEEVLALLPEMFPGVQEIPLKNIRFDPENPGTPITDEQIQDLADDMDKRGQQNPIQVCPYKAEPLARGLQAEGQALGVPGQGAKPQNSPGPLVPGVALHPDNPRIKADGTPWRLEDFNWMTLAGEGRSKAALRLHWKTIKGFIGNPTQEEAVKITYWDNKIRYRGDWWPDYQTIERLIKANPIMTQRQIVDELKMDDKKVNRAIRLLPLLNTEARALIAGNTSNSNKGIRGISEYAVFALAGLGPGTGLKPGVKAAGADTQKLWPYPPIPPETQDMVRRCLQVAIDQELTEVGVKGLVGFVQDGHKPEDYGSGGKEADKAVPKKGKYQQFEHKQVPVDRIRINLTWTFEPLRPDEIERKALSMKMTGFVKEIMVRTLLDEERAADPDHDYEIFDGVETFEAAKKLGMPMLEAIVHSGMDQWDAIGLLNQLSRVTRCNTWIETYAAIEQLLEIDPKSTVADEAMTLGKDTDLANEVFPVMALLNKSARNAIMQSIYKCHEGRTDNGGYRFVEELSIPLIRLGKISKDLEETQKAVEEVVNVAIENEMEEDEIEELVDWALDGNDPGEYFVEEA